MIWSFSKLLPSILFELSYFSFIIMYVILKRDKYKILMLVGPKIIFFMYNEIHKKLYIYLSPNIYTHTHTHSN